MGTFVGHIVPGLALALLGLWHTINTIRAYNNSLQSSTNFVSRFWYPFKNNIIPLSNSSKLAKHLELITLLSFSLFAIFMQVLHFPSLHFSFKLDDFEHATMFLHLAIFSGFTLFAELAHNSSERLNAVVSGILAASVFGQELFLLHYHSTVHVGLEGHYHWLLQIIVFLSFVSSLSATSFPTSFPSSLVLSISVVFQGFWFVNMGFMLWDPKFVPQGCVMYLGDSSSDNMHMHGAVVCETHEADSRARAVANLQFSWILAGISILVGSFCFLFGRNSTPRGQTTKYEQLHGRGSDACVALTGLCLEANTPTRHISVLTC